MRLPSGCRASITVSISLIAAYLASGLSLAQAGGTRIVIADDLGPLLVRSTEQTTELRLAMVQQHGTASVQVRFGNNAPLAGRLSPDSTNEDFANLALVAAGMSTWPPEVLDEEGFTPILNIDLGTPQRVLLAQQYEIVNVAVTRTYQNLRRDDLLRRIWGLDEVISENPRNATYWTFCRVWADHAGNIFDCELVFLPPPGSSLPDSFTERDIGLDLLSDFVLPVGTMLDEPIVVLLQTPRFAHEALERFNPDEVQDVADVDRRPRPITPIRGFSIDEVEGEQSATVSYIVDKEGDVTSLQIVESTHPEIDEAVLAYMQSRSFRPGVRRGSTVATRMQTTLQINEGEEIIYELADVDIPPSADRRIQPTVPRSFRHGGDQGSVILEYIITAEGEVADAEVVESTHDILINRSLDAIRQWRFEPALVDGANVPVRVTVTISFGAPEQDQDLVSYYTEENFEIILNLENVFNLADVDRPPIPISQTQPRMPHSFRARGGDGWVDLSFVVTADGYVVEAEARDASSNSLTRAALDAVRQWRFRPAILNGEAVSVRAAIRITFSSS